MAIPILKLIILIILLVLMIFLVRYVWDLFFGEGYEPVEWEQAKKKKVLSPELIREMKRYQDKVRFYAFWLQIERLKKEAIPGAFAELGVYKGETARLLHLMDPERALHLLDTFDGLPPDDLKRETGEAATYTNKNFKDTSAARVLDKIVGDHSRIKIHQGYFPESSSGLEHETFALVSLDADLYNPTLEGLRFFYPRLSPGGVLFVHDYNHKWEGLVKAFNEFTATIPEVPVLIPDLYGTVLIVKSRENSWGI